ncbi:MAG: alpha-D-ribose 1-methylphosphonate 5-triphosphate diphosphatase, partial [Dehalococcoidia bacterium]
AEELRDASSPSLDAGGAWLIPGLVDTHKDGLEAEVNPRPLVGFPPSFALANFERRAVAAGVTTEFHAITFADMTRNMRSIKGAVAKANAVLESGLNRPVEHHILHRCDVWSPDGLEPIFASMARSRVRAMSLNDHTPGQGQMRNIARYKERTVLARDRNPAVDIETDIARQMEDRVRDTETVPFVHRRAREELARQPYVLLSHDDDTAEKVDEMLALGAAVAEFPVTLEAARRAREHGMWITVGAPNIARGGSVSGNQSAEELVAEELADIICADYHAPSMLYAAWKLVNRGLCEMPEAIAKLTVNPARAFGMLDRGRIAPDQRADLCLVQEDGGVPRVTAVLRGGAVVCSIGTVEAEVLAPAGTGG